MKAISIKGLTKKYSSITANDDINLDVKSGEYIVLLGPTGSGKTTLLRCIAGLEDDYKGMIKIGKIPLEKMDVDERPVVFLGQDYSLFPHLNVWQNTIFGPTMQELTEKDIDSLGREMLSMVRLEERMDAFPGELSGGMKQRNALARALAYDARVVLLDEPLRALDARLRIDLRSEIRRLCKYLERTTVHVTHDQEEALTVADKIAIMKNGRLLQVGTPSEVYEKPATPFVQHFMGGANFVMGKIQKSDNGAVFESNCGGVKLEVECNDMEIGQDIVLSIKHDRTVLKRKADMTGKNILHGRIVQRQFAGAFTTFEVRTESNINLVARLPSSVEIKFEPGMDVSLELPKEHIVCFCQDEESLKRELEVDACQ